LSTSYAASTASKDNSKTLWDGESYFENSILQEKWAQKFFFNVHEFKGDEKVLDIGSGDGKLTSKLAKNAANTIGIDNSPSMVDKAKKDYGDANAKLDFVQQDASDSSFYKKHIKQFDLITSFTALHWVEDQLSVLEGIKLSLKDTGEFYIRTAAKGGDPIQDIADKMIKSEEYSEYFVNFYDPMIRYSKKEYEILVKKAELKLISLKLASDRDILNSRKDLRMQIISWLPHYNHLKNINSDINNNKIADKFLTKLLDEYLKLYPPTSEGKIILYDKYLEVIGTRG
jgi:ubiquinone/menaquinone biosynthesis C-methylase UbiE